MTSRAEAQRRTDEIRIFRDELARLEKEGVISLSGEQRAAVTGHQDLLLEEYARAFDVDREPHGKQLSRGMRIASFLGALALAASVFFLFQQFWGLFPAAVQVALLMAVALGTFTATVWIHGRDPTGYFAKLAAMIAFACFVINIAMLGGIFNLTPSDNALVAWAALALLLAYALDLRLLLAAGILCLIAYVSARTGTWRGMYWLNFGERPENFFPAAALLLLVPAIIPHHRFAGFAAAYRVFGLLTAFLPLLVLANVGYLSYVDADPDIIEGAYQVLGFAGSALAIGWGMKRGLPEVINTGLTCFVILLYTKFFDWWWEVMPKYLFFLVLGLASVLILMVLKRLRGTLYKAGAGGGS